MKRNMHLLNATILDVRRMGLSERAIITFYTTRPRKRDIKRVALQPTAVRAADALLHSLPRRRSHATSLPIGGGLQKLRQDTRQQHVRHSRSLSAAQKGWPFSDGFEVPRKGEHLQPNKSLTSCHSSSRFMKHTPRYTAKGTQRFSTTYHERSDKRQYLAKNGALCLSHTRSNEEHQCGGTETNSCEGLQPKRNQEINITDRNGATTASPDEQ